MSVTPSPMIPGKSPFHVRGSTYLGVREHIDRHVPGGFPAVQALLPDQAHKEFAAQVFLPVAMYDILPLLPLTQAIAIAEKIPYAQSVRQRAQASAHRDISGIYRLLFKAVSPATAAERLQRAILRYFDFGQVDIIDKSARRSLLEHKGLPRIMLPWYGPVFEGYTAAVMDMAGARNPVVKMDSPKRDGHRDGIDTASVRIELTWD